MSHFHWQTGSTLILHCHIQPNASCNEITGLHGDALKIRLQAPPVDGKANRELVSFLSKVFGVPKSQIELLKGQSNRRKTVSVISPQKIPIECLIATNN